MINLIIDNWVTVLYILLALCAIGYLIYKKKWDTLRRIAYDLILEAERIIRGTCQGMNRLNYVVDAMYSKFVPPWMRWFITREIFVSFVQKWFDEVKNLLEYTPMEARPLGTTKAEPPEVDGTDQC